MRFYLWTCALVAAVLCLIGSCLGVKVPGGSGALTAARQHDWYVEWYKAFLDQLVDKLGELTQRTEEPNSQDMDRIACAVGLSSMARHLTSSWGIQMLDSGTKLQSGLLQGNLNDLGQFDECLQVEVEANSSDPYSASFRGQHCLVSFNIHIPGNTLTLKGKETRLRELFGVDWIPLSVAQCWPSLCRPWVLEETLNEVVATPDRLLELFGEQYSLDLSIPSSDCQVKGQDTYDALDWIVLAIILLFLLIAGFSSAFDYFYLSRRTRIQQGRPHEQVLLAFSVYTNGRKLLQTQVETSNSLAALNGLKVFSIAWVVLGHKYRYLITQPIVNLLDFPEALKEWSKQILLSGPLSVDTFFLISGLLNSYTFALLREKKRYSPCETLLMYLHRYLRLTPAYLVMIGITATWLYRLGDGPYWERLVGVERDQCRTRFWANLIYLNNYFGIDYCMMQSWYLSADMQMFWLSPLVVYPLWRWPMLGFIQVAILVVLSILSPLLVSYIFEIRAPIPLTTDPVRSKNEMTRLYLPTHTKSVSYVIGILAGYIIYNIKKDKIKFRPNKATQAFFWLSAGLFMLFAMFGGYSIYQQDTEYNRYYSAFYIGFYRFFWALGVFWIILACVTGIGGPVNELLSWPGFGPLARLSYCVYLVHAAVILRSIASNRLPVYFTDYHQVEEYFGDLMISLIAATGLSLLFEAPAMQLEKILFSGAFKSKRERPPRASAPEAENHNHDA